PREARHPRHAPAQSPRPPDGDQAAHLRRRPASARGPEARGVRPQDPQGRLTGTAPDLQRKEPPMATEKKTAQQNRATGRRKTAIASVVLKPGTGKRLINNREFAEYCRNAIREMIAEQPLAVTGTSKDYDVIV